MTATQGDDLIPCMVYPLRFCGCKECAISNLIERVISPAIDLACIGRHTGKICFCQDIPNVSLHLAKGLHRFAKGLVAYREEKSFTFHSIGFCKNANMIIACR